MSSSIKSGIWMLFASINFALLNTLVKYLSEEYQKSIMLCKTNHREPDEASKDVQILKDLIKEIG